MRVLQLIFKFKVVFTNTKLDIDQAIRVSYRQSCSVTKTCHDPGPRGILSCYALLVMEATRDLGLPAPAVTLNGRWTHSTQARNSPHLLMSMLVITQ